MSYPNTPGTFTPDPEMEAAIQRVYAIRRITPAYRLDDATMEAMYAYVAAKMDKVNVDRKTAGF